MNRILSDQEKVYDRQNVPLNRAGQVLTFHPGEQVFFLTVCGAVRRRLCCCTHFFAHRRMLVRTRLFEIAM